MLVKIKEEQFVQMILTGAICIAVYKWIFMRSIFFVHTGYNSAVVNVPGECELSSTPGEGSLRLHNGTHVIARRGTLQIYRSGQWGEFCGQVQNYNRQSLDVICRQLGYRTWSAAG